MTDKLLITPQELEFALKKFKENKVMGPNQDPIDVIKLIDGDQIQVGTT